MKGTLAVIIAGSCVLPSCLGCTAIGADDGLFVQVGVTHGPLPPDHYAIDVAADGKILTIDEQLSADGSAAAIDPPDVDVGGKHLYATGVLFPNEGSITVGYREEAGPAQVVITIRRGATALVRHTYAPSYSAYRPNGVGCAPRVFQAHDTIAIP